MEITSSDVTVVTGRQDQIPPARTRIRAGDPNIVQGDLPAVHHRPGR
jgi:hypothetical protein